MIKKKKEKNRYQRERDFGWIFGKPKPINELDQVHFTHNSCGFRNVHKYSRVDFYDAHGILFFFARLLNNKHWKTERRTVHSGFYDITLYTNELKMCRMQNEKKRWKTK